MKNNPLPHCQKPLVIAHRGFSGKFPENTLLAFRKAIEFGVDMMECDVHFTKDLELIVTHDYKLGRTLPLKGNLNKFTFEELSRLDNGTWKSPAFSHLKAPSLRQLLELISNHPQVQLNIEIKKETIKNLLRTKKMAQKVIDLCLEMKVLDQVIISSFKLQALREVRKINADVKIGILDNFPNTGLKLRFHQSLNAYSYHPNFKPLRKKEVIKLHKLGLRIFPYTPNTDKDYQKLLRLGVDGMITDHVDSLQNFLANAKD